MRILVRGSDVSGFDYAMQKFGEIISFRSFRNFDEESAREMKSVLCDGPHNPKYSEMSAKALNSEYENGDVLYLDPCGNVFRVSKEERDSMAVTEEYLLHM